ncbi:MAG: hypothetical protein QOG53_258 [Frankiales bacterium]|nr:hypothetical protein [Frankiales bacterium]
MFWTESIVQKRGGSKALDTSVSEVPAEIDFDGLLDFYREELGEPVDAAYTDVPDVGRIDIGWVFDVPKGWKLPGPRKNYEMVVIPLVQDPDDADELISLGVLLTQFTLTESD